MRVALFLLLFLAAPVLGQQSVLDRISAEGVLTIGTTADYRPFSYFENDRLTGYDIELCRMIGAELGVEVRFVTTTWADLTSEMSRGRFHLAAGGITKTLPRLRKVGFSRRLFDIGKCPLVRKGTESNLDTLEELNTPGVVIAVNPGGTNELFVRKNFPRATVKVVGDNLAIPGLVAQGEADVMVTDSVEALQAAGSNPVLAAVNADHPWTEESLALMLPRNDPAFQNWINFFLESAERDGRLPALRRKFGVQF